MYPNTFYRVSVKALIKNELGEVLVVKENQDTWSLPGGGLDHGEDPRAGMRRELKEELGLEAVTISAIATVKTFYLEPKSAWLLWIAYLVEANVKELKLGKNVTDAKYIDSSQLSTSSDIFEKTVYAVATNR